MKRLTFVALATLMLLLGFDRTARALPTFSATCGTCHATTTRRLSVVSSLTLNLDGKRLDSKAAGTLRYFSVVRGNAITIPIDIINGSSKYSVAISNFSGGGLLNDRTRLLRYTVASPWSSVGTSDPYYVFSRGGIKWSGQRTRVYVTLNIKSNCPKDTYELRVTVAGTGGAKWSQSQRIYLRVR